jgi:hypothetical protein
MGVLGDLLDEELGQKKQASSLGSLVDRELASSQSDFVGPPVPKKLGTLIDAELAGDTDAVKQTKVAALPPPFVAEPPGVGIPEIADPQGLPTPKVPGKPGIGFKESLKEEVTTPAKGAQFVPGVGGVVGAAEQLLYLDAANRLRSDYDYTKPIRPEEIRAGAIGSVPARFTTKEADVGLIEDLLVRTQEQQERGHTFGGQVAKGLLNLPTWMAEFAMTGGFANLGSAAAKNAGEKLLKSWAKTSAGKTALKAAGWTGGAITRATLGLAPRIAEKAGQRQVQAQILGADQEGWATSFAKAWGDIVIESASETAGDALTGIPIKVLNETKFGRKFVDSLRKGWMAATGGKAGDFAREMLTAGGYSNIIGEYGEERLGNLLRALTDVDDFGAGKDANVIDRLKAAVKQDLKPKNIAVELTVLAAPMAGQVAIGTIGPAETGGKEQKAPEKPSEPRTPEPVADRTQEAPETQPASQTAQETVRSETTEQDVSGFLRSVRGEGAVEAKNRVKASENSGEIYDRVKAIGYSKWKQMTDEQKVDKINQIIDEVTPEASGEGKLPPHLQIIADRAKAIEKQKGFTIEDVTPEGFGPSETTEPIPREPHLTTEQMRLIDSINEGKTILKGKISGDKRVAVERSIANSEKKLKELTQQLTPTPEAAEKQPWEMTRREIADKIGYKGGLKLSDVNRAIHRDVEESNRLQKEVNKEVKKREKQGMDREDAWEEVKKMDIWREFTTPTPDLNQIQNHSLHIRKALEQGKPVPPEVLAEYPDLKPSKVSKKAAKKRISAKEEFKVGDVINTKGQSNMADPITIRAIEKNSIKFTDAEGVDYAGFSRSTLRRLIQGDAWEKAKPDSLVKESAKPITEEGGKGKGEIPLNLRTDAFNRTLDLIDKGGNKRDIVTQIEASQNRLDSEQKEFLYKYANIQPTVETKAKEKAKPTKRIITKDAYEKAKKRLTDRNKLNIGVDPQGMADLFTVGAYHFESGIRTFAAWSRKMVESLGNWVEPHLESAWPLIQSMFEQGKTAKEVAEQTVTKEKKVTQPISTANTAKEVDTATKELLEETSARQADLADDREALGLEAMPSTERKSWQKSLQNAKDQNIQDRALRLATEINVSARALNDEETAGLVIRATELKVEHRKAIRKIKDTTDQADIMIQSAEIGRIESEFNAITRALHISGTEKGRALVSQKLTIDRNFDLISVKARAKAAKGKELSAKESADFKELTEKLDKATEKIDDMQREIDELNATRFVRKGGLKQFGRMTAQQKNLRLDGIKNRMSTLLEKGCY